MWRAPNTEVMVKNGWIAVKTELQQYSCERTLTPSGLMVKRAFVVKLPHFTVLVLFLQSNLFNSATLKRLKQQIHVQKGGKRRTR